MNLVVEFDDVAPNLAVVCFTATVVGHLFDRLHLMSQEDKCLHLIFSKRARGMAHIDATKKDPYEMVILPQPPWMLLVSLSHEMIHLRDLVFGDMQATKHGILYKGSITTKAMMCLAHLTGKDKTLSYEQEPYAWMYSLADEILHQLPSELREFAEEQYLKDIQQTPQFPPSLSAWLCQSRSPTLKL